MRSEPDARLLDVTRLVSRAGRGPLTGVDRVELAYLSRLLDETVPLFALASTALGFVLLDRAGAAALAGRIVGEEPWGAPDMLGRLTHRHAPARAAAEADLRRLSLTRCRAAGLATMLGKQVPAGTAYLNVGHSNLSAPVLAALRRVPGARISVLIHDTIPLDFPQYSGAGIPDAFRDKLRAVGEHADLVICNSEVTHRDAARHMAEMGRVPPMTVAHLGVELPEPDPRGLPEGLDLSRPYFLTVGTIEPRKNHALLLDVWEGFHNDLPEDKIPRLFIAGTRGWRNEDVFRRLDSAPFMGRNVVELADLSDAALAALTQGATALLFPSHAEGYGLPPLEAAALGTPVIASDLPVHAEVLGDFAVYLSGRDAYSWRNKILGMTRGRGQTGKAAPQSGQGPALPTWDAHFETVLALT